MLVLLPFCVFRVRLRVWRRGQVVAWIDGESFRVAETGHARDWSVSRFELSQQKLQQYDWLSIERDIIHTVLQMQLVYCRMQHATIQ
jgi:hypothetical protein